MMRGCVLNLQKKFPGRYKLREAILKRKGLQRWPEVVATSSNANFSSLADVSFE